MKNDVNYGAKEALYVLNKIHHIGKTTPRERTKSSLLSRMNGSFLYKKAILY